MKQYDPAEVEPKWQKIWDETKLYEVTEDPARDKQYILDFFPYPSGSGLHVGHCRNYSISDAYPRFMRMRGYNVLHPMGWDAFGLPAENYAIKTGISPRQATDQNKATYKRQMKLMGFSYDWSREIDSSSPDYYKWTQWFFKLLYDRGLAYKKEALVNWDPVDKTVLANEQVINGRAERSGALVEKKPLAQWFFKITDYADRLLDELNDIDWPEGIKEQQRNWIGKSHGTNVDFELKFTKNPADNDRRGPNGEKAHLTVFTTRIDTIFSGTFLVLAPEHPWVQLATDDAHDVLENKDEVKAYLKSVATRSELERLEEDKDKTGVELKGVVAINPATGEEIPIWVADFVLGSYGTGAVFADGHDERDVEFARQYNIPIKFSLHPAYVRDDAKNLTEFIKKRKIVAVVENDQGELLTINWGPKLGGRLFIGGTVEGDEKPEATAVREVAEETGYTDLEVLAVSEETFYYKYFAFSKQEAHETDVRFVYLKLKSDRREAQQLDESEKDNFKVEWISRKEADAEIAEPLHRYGYDKFILGKTWTGDGILYNSAQFDGLTSAEAREKITDWLAEKSLAEAKVQYRMRDWLISRQRYWGAPIPIVYCEKCGEVPVPDDQLPVLLPELDDYQPADDGRSPLARATDWVNTTCPKCDGPAKRETDTMDGFACSSWYFLRFASPQASDQAFDPAAVKYWLPVDMYIGGAEHAVMHLLYARFWTKVMHDAKLIDFTEPFHTLRNQGLILAPDSRKMSKRWGNVITPDELVEKGYSADSIRTYELFIAPYDQTVPWNPEGLDGVRRFLNKVWTVAQTEMRNDTTQTTIEAQALSRLHKTIKKVTEDLTDFKFNTAVAALMELTNYLYAQREKTEISAQVWRDICLHFALLLAPFAPFMAEEIWHELGETESVHLAAWPQYDSELVKDDLVTIVVQVNGKVRGEFVASAEAAQDKAQLEANALSTAKDWLEKHHAGAEAKKIVTIPGKLVNIVI